MVKYGKFEQKLPWIPSRYEVVSGLLWIPNQLLYMRLAGIVPWPVEYWNALADGGVAVDSVSELLLNMSAVLMLR